MKANELRLGNLVDLGNRIAKITEIYPLACMVADLEQTQDTLESYERVTGIPLTEEWLLKFGFVINTKDLNFWNHKICIHALDNKFYVLQEQGRVYLDYIHQLQNLYWCLCGEELIIKE